MNLERFERQYSNLADMFRKKGFYKKPDKFEERVFVKFVDYRFEMDIITSRLEEEVSYADSLIKSLFSKIKKTRELDEDKARVFVITNAKIRLDLLDFYTYTRVFLDTLTMSIKLSFKRAGNRKWNAMKNSIASLLNEKKLALYKKEIDSDFFEGLEKRISWIPDFKKYRDGLLHKSSHFVFATTKRGEFGYDIVNGTKTSWGTDTVKGILTELQSFIDNLSDLMEFLSENLPTLR